jgi:SAM-dependent methyltransferase
MDERVAVNRLRWDQMARLHLKTYDLAAEDEGRNDLAPFEFSELGDLDGKRICHLQCHLGGDSMALARRGAQVVGVDFSSEALDTARVRAERTGLSGRLTYVLSDVYDAPDHIDGLFDVVYTSWGVLVWLPDINRWAETVARLLKHGGFLYLAETHPYAEVVRYLTWKYGGATPHFDDSQGDYTDKDAIFENPEAWEWSHGLGEVVTALVDSGLRIEFLHEHPSVVWDINDPRLSRRDDGMFESEGSTAPLSYSIRATLP